MNKPLRLLIVEDSESDALLIVEQLKSNGYEVVFEQVETEEAMKAALDKAKWDAIISDYKMPHFKAFRALEVLQEKCLDIPFIVVSGVIGEETAVEMMRKGAQDYLLKSNLKKLSATIEREMCDAEVRREHKRIEKELKERLKELEIFFEANVSRENRMVELKDEIAALNARIKKLESKLKEK